PIQCSFVMLAPTTDPARWRLGSTANAVCAVTARKMTPPNHTVSDRIMSERRIAIRTLSPSTARLGQNKKLGSEEWVRERAALLLGESASQAWYPARLEFWVIRCGQG